MRKTVPKNSIFIIIKFNSKDKVREMLDDPEYQKAFSKIMNLSVVKDGRTEYFKAL